MRALARSSATVMPELPTCCSTVDHRAVDSSRGHRVAPGVVGAGRPVVEAVLRLVIHLDRVRDERL